MSQFLNLFKSVASGNNLSLMTSLAGPVQDKIMQSVGGSIENLASASPEMVENVSSAIEQKAPVLSNSITSISTIYRWRRVIIVMLVLWAIFMAIYRIFIKDDEARDYIDNANKVLIGNNGVLLLIGYIWFGSLLVIAIVPALVAITPKLENILGSVDTALTTFTGK